MTELRDDITGFEAGEKELPTPEIQIEDATRSRLERQLYAMVLGATPEEIAEQLVDGFGDRVEADLSEELVRVEMSAHVDLLLLTLQAPAG